MTPSSGGSSSSRPEDIAGGVGYMVTRPRHAAVGELWIMPTEEA
ncbi:hypothetical protein [Nonomuraea sp. NPDC050202]